MADELPELAQPHRERRLAVDEDDLVVVAEQPLQLDRGSDAAEAASEDERACAHDGAVTRATTSVSVGANLSTCCCTRPIRSLNSGCAFQAWIASRLSHGRKLTNRSGIAEVADEQRLAGRARHRRGPARELLPGVEERLLLAGERQPGAGRVEGRGAHLPASIDRPGDGRLGTQGLRRVGAASSSSWRSSIRRILPVSVFGRSGTNSIRRG